MKNGLRGLIVCLLFPIGFCLGMFCAAHTNKEVDRLLEGDAAPSLNKLFHDFAVNPNATKPMRSSLALVQWAHDYGLDSEFSKHSQELFDEWSRGVTYTNGRTVFPTNLSDPSPKSSPGESKVANPTLQRATPTTWDNHWLLTGLTDAEYSDFPAPVDENVVWTNRHFLKLGWPAGQPTATNLAIVTDLAVDIGTNVYGISVIRFKVK